MPMVFLNYLDHVSRFKLRLFLKKLSSMVVKVKVIDLIEVNKTAKHGMKGAGD